MSTKRQPSKQRRQTQNQKQRTALEARRQAAAAGGSSAGQGDAASASTAASNGSVLSRFRGAKGAGRAARTGGTGTLPPGHRAALSALLAAIAGALVGSFLFQVPVGRDGEPVTTQGALAAEWSLSAQEVLADAPEVTAAELSAAVDDWLPGGSEPYIQAFWPVSLTVLLPVIGTALGFRAVSKRSPAKVVNRTMYVTLFGALLASQLLLIFLPAVIALAVAAFQVRKAEVQAAAATAPADAVIDVDEVAVTDDEIIEAEVVDAEIVGEAEVDDPAEEAEPR